MKKLSAVLLFSFVWSLQSEDILNECYTFLQTRNFKEALDKCASSKEGRERFIRDVSPDSVSAKGYLNDEEIVKLSKLIVQAYWEIMDSLDETAAHYGLGPVLVPEYISRWVDLDSEWLKNRKQMAEERQAQITKQNEDN